MKLSDFDFFLPEDLIAQTPASIRNESRLLVLERNNGTIHHDSFANLSKYLFNHPLMVFNDTQVIPVKLFGHEPASGKRVEILLIREEETGVWESLVKGLGKFKPGAEWLFGNGELSAVLLKKREGRGVLRFSWSGSFEEILNRVGEAPLPPYIKRDYKESEHLKKLDRERYQTVYAKKKGAIAAPTAGLHFIEKQLNDIQSRHADVASLTLHVGPGTFQPIRVEDVTSHKMEREYFHIPKETWNLLFKAKNEKQSILAVGTTATRVLESVDIQSATEQDVDGWTDRFIFPGKNFETVNHLLTNFHLPKSTLYLLVCAFAGKERMEKTYSEAVKKRYRFFSYGDAMLIL